MTHFAGRGSAPGSRFVSLVHGEIPDAEIGVLPIVQFLQSCHALPVSEEVTIAMCGDVTSPDIGELSDHGDSYLCRHCNHEGLKPTFGLRTECPVCESADIVCAKFWRRFKTIHQEDE